MARKKKEVIEQVAEPIVKKNFAIYHLQRNLDLSWSKRKVKVFETYKPMYEELLKLNLNELPNDFFIFELD